MSTDPRQGCLEIAERPAAAAHRARVADPDRPAARCALRSPPEEDYGQLGHWASRLRRLLGPVIVLLSGAIGSPVLHAGQGPGLGRPIPLDEIAEMSIHVFPNGSGLPPGRGTAAEGREIYDSQCASCHGPNGSGGSAEELAGARNSLTDDPPDKTIGTYWPYATTLFDYIRRSMPLNAPRSLSADQVYAVTAYLLYLNGVIERDRILDEATLAGIQMPNRNGFIPVYQQEQP